MLNIRQYQKCAVFKEKSSMCLELGYIKRKENKYIKSKDEILKEYITIGRRISLQINGMKYHGQLYIKRQHWQW